MGLSNDIISKFVKYTNDSQSKVKTDTITYGEVVSEGKDGTIFVVLDGTISDGNGYRQTVPAIATVACKPSDRVIVMIKNHSAVITGNLGNPSTSANPGESGNDTPRYYGDSRILDVEVALADKISATELDVELARIEVLETDSLLSKSIKSNKAKVKELQADQAEFETALADKISTKELNAELARAEVLETDSLLSKSIKSNEAEIEKLKVASGDFEQLDALFADIEELKTDKLDVTSANAKYAKIDFSNIGEAAITKLFSDSGLIEDLIVGDGTITGKLVGVTITGDLIEGNTVIADKLVIKGEDGLYYKLNIMAGATTSKEVTEEDLQNGLHGTTIIAKTITAEKISVDDLVAFDATIGGFNISENSLYSGVKSSVHNTTQGFYVDSKDGQMSLGDSNNFIKYYKTQDGTYKLEIASNEIKFGDGSRNIGDLDNDVATLKSHVKITYEQDGSPVLNLVSGSDRVQLKVTNSGVDIFENGELSTHISNRMLNIDSIYAVKEAQVGPFVMSERANGNVGLKWKGGGNG